MGRSIADILYESAKTKLVTSNVNKGDIFRMKLTDEEGITPKTKEIPTAINTLSY